MPDASSRSKKRKRGGPCKAEFDYIGWAEHGAWRRTVLLNSNNKHPRFRSQLAGTSKLRSNHEEQANEPGREEDSDEGERETGLLLESRRWVPASSLTRAWGDEYRALDRGIGHLMDRFAEKKEALFVRRQHNCWLHCDFPSECHHAIYKAQSEGRPVLAGARAVDEAYVRMEKARHADRAANGKETRAGPSGLRDASSNLGLVTIAMSRDDLPSNMRGNVPTPTLVDDDEEDDSSDYSSDEEDDSALGWSPFPQVEATQPQKPESLRILGVEPEVGITPVTEGVKRRFTSTDLEGDYSYETFKKSSVTIDMATPTTSVPAPQSVALEIESHANDSSISAVTSSVNAEPIYIHMSASGYRFASDDQESDSPDEEEEELDAFLASLYTTAAQHPHHHAGQAQPIAAPLLPSAQEGELSHLRSFTPYESFHGAFDPSARRAYDDARALEDAYSSQQPWFPSSSPDADSDIDIDAETDDAAARSRKRARRLSRERMLTLLGRRTSSLDRAPEYHQQPHHHHHHYQPPPLHIASSAAADDNSWESDSSAASAGSSSASGESDGTAASSSSAGDEDGVLSPPSCWSLAVVGSSTMAGDDALALPRLAMPTILEEGEADEDMSCLFLTTPTPLIHNTSGGGEKQRDIIELTRMRYEFMMGRPA